MKKLCVLVAFFLLGIASTNAQAQLSNQYQQERDRRSQSQSDLQQAERDLRANYKIFVCPYYGSLIAYRKNPNDLMLGSSVDWAMSATTGKSILFSLNKVPGNIPYSKSSVTNISFNPNGNISWVESKSMKVGSKVFHYKKSYEFVPGEPAMYSKLLGVKPQPVTRSELFWFTPEGVSGIYDVTRGVCKR